MSDSPQLITVILTTYNSPIWLSKVLWGYACQCHQAFEVIVADDGSGPETAAVVEEFREHTGLRLRHVWQPDDGFRKCQILNRAIRESRGDYLLFSDGDCIPRNDFVRVHHENAARGHFLSGGYYKLPMSISEAMTESDIRSGDAFRWSWLRTQGLTLSHRNLRLLRRPKLATWLNRITTTRPTWNGNNASGWANDIDLANGFDERMRYGGEDRELGERLEHAGIRGKHVRYQALCLHLDHERGYVSESDWQRNHEIRRQTRRLKRIQTSHGLRRAA